MTAIGFVTRTTYGGFRGQLKLLPVCADIDIVPNRDKSGDISPDFRIFSQRARGRIWSDFGRREPRNGLCQPVTGGTWSWDS
ncbi:DUF736 family protein [Bradyrhizobium centrosematis]|uniref:DUF736 family protein n=1 Tax=Bradyrhizobium centrosematis TaxID=1300039 RepID=UPI002169B7C8|nr:DUF736 family protein [Bradyrhizobium centrosematis]MCS3761321.1 uncharacterized protein (DUF736 family) [Bradyrhizobium centrosematis]MCS3770791.1 uncharacterized protein (DUF736 family) [Bradyrhizobium centrosematis]